MKVPVHPQLTLILRVPVHPQLTRHLELEYVAAPSSGDSSSYRVVNRECCLNCSVLSCNHPCGTRGSHCRTKRRRRQYACTPACTPAPHVVVVAHLPALIETDRHRREVAPLTTLMRRWSLSLVLARFVLGSIGAASSASQSSFLLVLLLEVWVRKEKRSGR